MQKQFEEVEQQLMAIYAEAKKEIPGLNCLSFTVSQNRDSAPHSYGFIHINNDCELYKSMTKLATLIAKAKERRSRKKILYQSFDHIL